MAEETGKFNKAADTVKEKVGNMSTESKMATGAGVTGIFGMLLKAVTKGKVGFGTAFAVGLVAMTFMANKESIMGFFNEKSKGLSALGNENETDGGPSFNVANPSAFKI